MNAPNQSGWKPTSPGEAGSGEDCGPATASGNKGLMLEEPLIFEIGTNQTTGVDLPQPQQGAPNRLGGRERTAPHRPSRADRAGNRAALHAT